MARKRGLGRGIGALIPSAAPAPAQDVPAGAAAQADAPQEPSVQETPTVDEAPADSPSNEVPATEAGNAAAAEDTAVAEDTAAPVSEAAQVSEAEVDAAPAPADDVAKEEVPAAKASEERESEDKAPEVKPAESGEAKKSGSKKSKKAKKAKANPATTEPAPAAEAAKEAQESAEPVAAEPTTASPATPSRPVDMFFTGEPRGTQASASSVSRELAERWARDARSKRRAPRTHKVEPAASASAEAPVAAQAVDAAPVAAVEAPAPASRENAAQAAPAPAAVPHNAAPSSAATGVAEALRPTDTVPAEGLVPVPGAEFAEIPLSDIRENPRNPRTVFDEDELDELAYSLREVGVLQPIVVRPIKDAANGELYEIVMGERRWRAAQRGGLTAIPAIIRSTTDDDLLRDALLENLHRSQLNPLEEAAAYSQLLEDFNCTQDELADRIGRSRPQISNTLRLLRLPPLVQRRLQSGALSAGHARALLGLDDAQLQEELAQRIVTEGLSVRAVERLIANGVESSSTTRSVRRRTNYNPRVVSLTSSLSTKLEAPVRIDVGKRKGKITLEFTTLDDLERIMEKLGIEE